MSSLVIDEEARRLARIAQADIDRHMATCAVQYERLSSVIERNEKQLVWIVRLLTMTLLSLVGGLGAVIVQLTILR